METKEKLLFVVDYKDPESAIGEEVETIDLDELEEITFFDAAFVTLKETIDSKPFPEDKEYSFLYLYDSKADCEKAFSLKGKEHSDEKFRILELIRETNPKTVVFLGNSIFKFITGRSGIGKNRGNYFEYDGLQCTVTYSLYTLSGDLRFADEFYSDILRIIYRFIGNIDYTKFTGDYNFYYDAESIVRVCKFLKDNYKLLAVDIETNSLEMYKKGTKIISVSFSPKAWVSYCFPVEHISSKFSKSDLLLVIEAIKSIMEDTTIKFIGHNFKFDTKFFIEKYGIKYDSFTYDTMLMCRVCYDDIKQSQLSQKSLAWLHTNLGGYEEDMLDMAKESHKNRIRVFNEFSVDNPAHISYELDIPIEKLLYYNAIDTDVCFQLYEKFINIMKLKRFTNVYNNVIEPAYKALTYMEANGLLFDLDSAKKMDKDLEISIKNSYSDLVNSNYCKLAYALVLQKKADKIKAERLKKINEFKRESKKESALSELSDYVKKQVDKEKQNGFNLNSTAHLRALFYDTLNATVVNRTKTGEPSTDKSTLKLLANKYPFVNQLLDHKLECKIHTGYIKPMIEGKNIYDGYYHFDLNMAGTVSGRLSGGIHTIPKSSKFDIKSLFIAHEGYKVLQADLSQAELRVMAVLAGETSWLELYRNNIGKHPDEQIDLHCHTASLVFNKDYKEVWKDYKEGTGKLRQFAKAVNFGIIYGMTAKGLSQQVDISQKEAQGFIDKYLEKTPFVTKFIKKTHKDCKKHGFVTNPFGRRRTLLNINSPNKWLRMAAERQSVNFLVQSTASDLFQIAMGNIHRDMWNRNLASCLLVTVHDSLVAESPIDEIAIMKDIMVKHMTNFPGLNWMNVPMVADVDISDSWSTKEKK